MSFLTPDSKLVEPQGGGQAEEKGVAADREDKPVHQQQSGDQPRAEVRDQAHKIDEASENRSDSDSSAPPVPADFHALNWEGALEDWIRPCGPEQRQQGSDYDFPKYYDSKQFHDWCQWEPGADFREYDFENDDVLMERWSYADGVSYGDGTLGVEQVIHRIITQRGDTINWLPSMGARPEQPRAEVQDEAHDTDDDTGASLPAGSRHDVPVHPDLVPWARSRGIELVDWPPEDWPPEDDTRSEHERDEVRDQTRYEEYINAVHGGTGVAPRPDQTGQALRMHVDSCSTLHCIGSAQLLQNQRSCTMRANGFAGKSSHATVMGDLYVVVMALTSETMEPRIVIICSRGRRTCYCHIRD